MTRVVVSLTFEIKRVRRGWSRCKEVKMIGFVSAQQTHRLQNTHKKLEQVEYVDLTSDDGGQVKQEEDMSPAAAVLHRASGLLAQHFMYRPATVLILGDSFIKRLQCYSFNKFGQYDNLGLHYQMANVQWHGVSGLTLRKLQEDHM